MRSLITHPILALSVAAAMLLYAAPAAFARSDYWSNEPLMDDIEEEQNKATWTTIGICFGVLVVAGLVYLLWPAPSEPAATEDPGKVQSSEASAHQDLLSALHDATISQSTCDSRDSAACYSLAYRVTF